MQKILKRLAEIDKTPAFTWSQSRRLPRDQTNEANANQYRNVALTRFDKTTYGIKIAAVSPKTTMLTVNQ
jgi:hypothetical protein